MPKQFLGYRKAEGCPQKNQGEDMNNQPYSGAERHVEKVPHSGVETSLSSRVSAPTSRPTHVYPQQSQHHATDHINTYTKPATSLPAATHSSISNVSNILPTGVRAVDGRIGRALGKMPSVTICNNVDALKTCNTLSSSGASNIHVPFAPQTSVLQLATTTVPTVVETSSTNPSMSLAANSPAFRSSGVGGGGGGGGGGAGGGGVVSTCGQSTPAGHHMPTFTSHLPRGAAAASALSVPKPGSSMSAAAAATVMRPNQPSPILSNTNVFSQMNRNSLISTIKPTAPTVTGPRANQPSMAGAAPTSQIILRSEKPRIEKQPKKHNLFFRQNMPVYSDSAAVVTAAQSTNSNIHITLKKRNTTDATKSQVMFSHGQGKALPVNPSISHSSPTTATAVASKMISQASLTPLAPNIAIKPGGAKWNTVNQLVDLTKEASKSMATKTLAAISMPNQPAATSSSSVTQAAAVSTTATTSTTSIPSSIPIAKVTPQRQQASSHITQAAAAAAAAAVHPINQETRSDSQSHGQPTQTAATNNYFIPAQAPRASAGCTSLATTISSGNPTVTHTDNRQEGRATVVPHMQQYMQPELIYKMSYPVYPMSHATVRPSIISSNTANYSTTLPTAGGHCMNLTQNTSAMHVNSMLVAVDPLRGSFPVTSQYTPAQAVSTTMTANTTTPVVTATQEMTPTAEIVSCSAPTPVSILSGAALIQQAPSSLPNNTNTPNINNSSPRPSILRKRPNDGAAVSVKKSFGLHSSSSTEITQSPRQDSIPQSNTSSPKTPAGDNSQSSTDTALSTEAGSTITPTSIGDCRNQSDCLETHEQNGVVSSSLLSTSILPNLQNNVEASPRKKPRKQMLNANEELKDNTSTDDEYDKLDKMEESKEYKSREIKSEVKDEYTDEEGVRWTTEKRRPNLSLINFYSMSWKVRNNHFQRHSDVKSKEDRRSSVNELSNQRGVVQKASGWKLYFLATQLEDMNDMEKVICNQMCKLQETIAPKALSKQGTQDSDEVRLHELTQANIQRCKLVIDQLSEAHDSMLKILDHKDHILEIINKNISKRPIKKKERT
ncbi:histone deacetylase complex subunit SAP130 isoform X2 [Octopus bimaculoides]|uniref:histone deacetylase complex subunit SAP130 isoform X2 n=1 Tax=Octopus bimaculoides TaxID=37653 RepID=UPI00071CCFF1|nr:histone deacetylase complex subunit SAP130 isoform X2 [Octopus bimaculoides]|eukprot:XP_014779021.1 PREDICTED: histone deacetylase complex subunit SAP130-like isoform X3 [Octopus bimaculoides]